MERPVANDDQITIDLIAKVEDKEVANQTDVVYLVTEHNNRPVEGFHAYLLDMVLNDTKTFTIPFPEEYEDKEVAGKECEFTVTLKDVKAKDLAELDDEFAKGIGDGFDSVEALREQIKNTMKPIINLLISQLYPYIFVSIVLVLISFLLILATFIMVLQIKFLTRVKKNIL